MRDTRKIFISIAAVLSLFAGNAFVGLALAETQADQSDTEVLFTGEWTKKTFKSSGTWSIYSIGDKTYIKLSSDFRTRNAPDLKIFLSPLTAAETNGKNATDGSFKVAKLTSNKGKQVYELPDSIDLTDYRSILIHCEQYSKLWSAADLV